MRDTMNIWCDRIIRYGVYALFFLVPLTFTNSTSELFELNKMWITWEISLFIFAAWAAKMISNRQFAIKRTPLDIPIILFLISQIISTIFSLDPHTSFWGYYSRFNGGLLSLISYFFLYYAIASNFTKEHIITLLKISVASAILVALWGLPSHFGKDPTCLIFRGTLDVSCWTAAFAPTIRIFSTLGQPAWMAAYMNVVIPLTIALSFISLTRFLPTSAKSEHTTSSLSGILLSWKLWTGILIVALFFACLIFTNTRAGIIAFWIANGIFWLALGIKRYFTFNQFLTFAVLFNTIFLLFHFFLGTSFSQLDKYTMSGLLSQKTEATAPAQSAATAPMAGTIGGTDSGKIRQIVWQGAIEVWKAYPVFGSGVETFAFSYYRYRPADHNLTSEWDYLYNKAHNEYLNYLATTGIVGLGTYLIIIGLFLFLVTRYTLLEKSRDTDTLLVLSLVAGFISILITNFFGFSVVIMNLYLFLIPIFVFHLKPEILGEKWLMLPKTASNQKQTELSLMQWIVITIISFMTMFLLIGLIRDWYADKAYALGSNLNQVQQFQASYLKLGEAVHLRPSEPVFKDEFAVNNAMIATVLLLQEAPATPSAEVSQQAAILSKQAIELSNEVTTQHPNNISFWKNRVRLFYTLSQVDPRYRPLAIQAVEKVHSLAPTDAKVMYNMGALYLENGDIEKATKTLEGTILLKPDYRDAYFSLATAYNTMAVDENKEVVRPEMRQKAIRQLQFILDRLSPDDTEAKETLSSWTDTN